jgi:hypothetical protein
VRALVALPLVALVVACTMPQQAPLDPNAGVESRHEGYYYPRIGSTEVYTARAQALEDSDRMRRLGFVAVMLAQQLDLPYPPAYMLFAKGDNSQKMIIIGLREDFDTLYRARAQMAMLTTIARESPLFQDLGVNDVFTFYDLAKMLDFKEIVLSDGKSYAHRVVLK